MWDLAMDTLSQVLVAIVIMIAGFFVGRTLGRAVERWLRKLELEPPVRFLLVRALRAVTFALFAVMALHGSARAFLMPAKQAILRDLVNRDDFERAVAISSSAFQIGVIAGPAAVYASAGTLLGIAIILICGTRPRRARRAVNPFDDGVL